MPDGHIEYNLECSEDREQRELEELDEYLSGIEPGYTLVLSRVEPGWCKGLLEEISVTQTSAPVDINYIINTWGGHKIRLRFRRPDGKWAKFRDVELYTFQPLIYGRTIERSAPNPHKQLDKSPEETALVKHDSATFEPPESKSREMLEMMEVIQRMRAADMQAMAAMIQAQQQNQQPPQDPFKIMNWAFTLFSQFQQARAPELPSSENDEILGLLGKLTDAFGSNGRSDRDTRIIPPVGAAGDNRPLHELIASMSPSEALSTFRQAVGSMTPENQQATVSELIGQLEHIGGRETLLSVLEQKGILELEENYDNDEIPPAAQSADSRGKPRSNG
jgi:hypothetical protein